MGIGNETHALPVEYRTPPQERLITYKQDATPQDRNDGTRRHGMARDAPGEYKHEERDEQDETRSPMDAKQAKANGNETLPTRRGHETINETDKNNYEQANETTRQENETKYTRRKDEKKDETQNETT